MLATPEGHCFHCHLPIPENISFHSVIFSQEAAFCCPGCQAVCETIVDNGLGDYYKYRTEAAAQASELTDTLSNDLKIFDEPAVQEEFVSHYDNNIDDIELTIEGLNCPACAWLIERQLVKTDGVVQIGVDVSARRATVKWNNDSLKLSQILKQLSLLGYKAHPFSPDHHEQVYQQENKRFLKKLGLAGIMTMQVMMIAFALYFGVFGNLDPETKDFLHWVSFVLTAPVVLYSASGFFSSALNGLAARTLNMDLPISVAIGITFVASGYATIYATGAVFFESICMFVFLLLIGRYMELKGREKAVMVANNINKQLPTMAHVKQENGQYLQSPAKLVSLGQTIQIKPGDIVPVDATIIEGSSRVDESLLTGESHPVSKTVGDAVFGGTVNQEGALLATVTQKLSQSAIYQIMKLQRFAVTHKPKFALLTDQIASYFVAAVLLISAITFGYWYFTDPQQAVWITVTVLVATCPCALGLATPTAFSAAIARLSQNGFLLKRADILETLNIVDHVVFDKTGTLTEGKFQINRVKTLSSLAENDVINIAANIEQHSEHPIASAFTITKPLTVNKVTNFPGEGIEAWVDETQYRIGSLKFATSDNSDSKELQEYRVFLSIINGSQHELIAAFDISDKAKAGAECLHTGLRDKQLILLSGDKSAQVNKLAEHLKFDKAYGECQPQDKLDIVTTLQSQHSVMMIGDGMNDSPVLSKADVSLAVSGATDFARHSADIVMLNEQIQSLPELFLVAKKTFRTIKQNIGWSIGYNILVLPLAVSGMLSPWMAVVGMSLSSVIVTYNSTRIITQNRR